MRPYICFRVEGEQIVAQPLKAMRILLTHLYYFLYIHLHQVRYGIVDSPLPARNTMYFCVLDKIDYFYRTVP